MAKEIVTEVEYRDIPGFKGYRVGSDGSVLFGDVEIKQYRAGKGHYRYIAFRVNGKQVNRYVHRLVLEAFVGPCHPGMECCHNNGITSDNRLVNIEWGTRKKNAADKIRHGTQVHGERQRSAKLNATQVQEIRREYANGGISQHKLAKKYNVQVMTINYLLKRTTWARVA